MLWCLGGIIQRPVGNVLCPALKVHRVRMWRAKQLSDHAQLIQS